MPTAVAVSVVKVNEAAAQLIFKIPVLAFVIPPLPMSAVATVSVVLFVSVTPVTVTLGIVKIEVPDSA